jgi:hypothetical protein
MEEQPNDQLEQYKCFSCGKDFKYQSHFERHQNKRTPCLIREIPDKDKANPNRCIYCNKIMSRKPNLIKHLKTCKVKNGGMDILDDKVRHEQEIRILKEQRTASDKQIANLEQQNAVIKQQNDMILDKLNKLDTNQTKNVTNNTMNGNVNNTVNNVQIVLNNFQTPNLDGITITPEELIGIDNLPRYMLIKIYCNQDKPENHSIYFPNKKEPRVLFYDRLQWQSYTGEALKNKLTMLSNTNYLSSRELFFGPRGMVANDDEELFEALPGAVKNIIIEQLQKVQISHEDILEALLGAKAMIEKTKKICEV